MDLKSSFQIKATHKHPVGSERVDGTELPGGIGQSSRESHQLDGDMDHF